MPAHNRSGDTAPAGRAPAERAPSERAPAERAADHAALARLADTLVPALVGKLGAGSLGEIEIREDGWAVRVRRFAPGAGRRAADRAGDRAADRTASSARHAGHPGHTGPHAPAAPATAAAETAASAPDNPRHVAALAPAVGVFRPGLAVGARVRAGDRVAVVDLLGIPQDVVAPVDGTLVEVLAQAGDGVEYGQEVAVIEPAAPKPAPVADGED